MGFPAYGFVSFTPIRTISSARLKQRLGSRACLGMGAGVFGRHTSLLMGPRASDWRSLRFSDHQGPCLAQWHDPNNALNGRHFAHYGSLPVAVFWWGRLCPGIRRLLCERERVEAARKRDIVLIFAVADVAANSVFVLGGFDENWQDSGQLIGVMMFLLAFYSGEITKFLKGIIVVSKGKRCLHAQLIDDPSVIVVS